MALPKNPWDDTVERLASGIKFAKRAQACAERGGTIFYFTGGGKGAFIYESDENMRLREVLEAIGVAS